MNNSTARTIYTICSRLRPSGARDALQQHHAPLHYIHGSPKTVEMGKPGSICCVRMRNNEIVELFDLVPPYTPVHILG